MVQTVPDELPPGSDVANLGLLGYDATQNYTGRAPIEAAGAGLALTPNQVAVRCNLVTVQEGRMVDYSAGHIETPEAHALIHAIQKKLGSAKKEFRGGVSYRHLLLWQEGPENLKTQPPHDIADQSVEPHLPSGERSEEFRELMDASKSILKGHPVNLARIKAGHLPATQIWLWGQGKALQLQSFQELYGLSGAIISAVDLVRGLGLLAGLEAPVIEGATGLIDTNYEGKVAAAIDTLKNHDFVFVHVEAPDECGHMGDAELKTEAIRRFDARVVKPIWEYLESQGDPYRLLICMDHRTPVALKGHTREPVPMAVLEGPTGPLMDETDFDETCNGGAANAVSHSLVSGLLAT
jgi:2,3-bisphosphoglycerate-independent phosphoglycerate mutase